MRVTPCGAARRARALPTLSRSVTTLTRAAERRRGSNTHAKPRNDGRTRETMLASAVGWPRQLGERSCSSDFHGDSHATTCADWCKREKASNHWCANESACTMNNLSSRRLLSTGPLLPRPPTRAEGTFPSEPALPALPPKAAINRALPKKRRRLNSGTAACLACWRPDAPRRG